MGRIAQAKEVKDLKGTGNSTREHRRGEPSYPPETQLVDYNPDTKECTIPIPPEGLSTEAQQLWSRLAYQLAVMNLFPNSVYEYLHNYCRLHDVAEAAFLEYGGSPTLSDAKGGISPNPAFRVYKDATTQMLAIGAKLGFTPADKTRINMSALTPRESVKNDIKKIGVNG